MKQLIQKIINQYHYSIESVKNRYPCKIIFIKLFKNFEKAAEIKYIAATKTNIRTSKIQDILNDPLLVEKFHPTDGVKLGFLSVGEIIFKDDLTIDELRKLYLKIIQNMFEDLR